MGASSSAEQTQPVKQREVEAEAASAGALPMLQRWFSRNSNPQTKTIPATTLENCFSLTFHTSVCEAAGFPRGFPDLMDHFGPSLVHSVFLNGSEEIGWTQFVEGYVGCCGRVANSDKLQSALKVFTRAAHRAGLCQNLKLECGKNPEVHGWFLCTDLQLFFLIFWMMLKANDRTFDPVFPDLDNMLWCAVVSCAEDETVEFNTWDCEISTVGIELSIVKIVPWVLKKFPFLTDCFVGFIHERLQRSSTPGDNPELPLKEQPSVLIGGSNLLTRGRAWAISLTLKDSICKRVLQSAFLSNGMRSVLYRSSVHGKGLGRLWSRIEGYSGPVLLLVSGISGTESVHGTRRWIVGALVQEGFEDRTSFYGNSGHLYAVSPVFSPFAPSGREKNFVYSHVHRGGRGYEGSPKVVGIGFGGILGKERVFMDEDFSRIVLRHHASDHTYESGPLLPHQGFVPVEAFVLEVECWGLGGAAAVDIQTTYRNREQLFIEQRRKVDLGAMGKWNESPDKMMMDMVSSN